MKKLLFFLFATASLYAAPQAVVFDYGGVLAKPNRDVAIKFLCRSLHISAEELKKTKPEREAFFKNGQSEKEFWLQFALQKNIELPEDWTANFSAAMKTALGTKATMFALVDELKKQQIPVGLLSNVNERSARFIRSFGFYSPFDPCLLSCELGMEKPNPKIFQILVEKMQLSPHDIVFIDDLPENIAAAKKVGIDAILFKSSKQIRKALEKRGLLQ